MPPLELETNSTTDPLWYKEAVVYELRVRSFADANGDGYGDFAGATSRLDYLRDLGVTALWLLPFFPSPGRDDGYDIANYCDVHPEVGTLADFRAFLREAHQRNIRVMIDLVLNHTSDQHPWFQQARRAPRGSPERAMYVWSDTDDRYLDAPIIFADTESSNWTWDPVAGQFYWHRFYAHQPDLNYDHPRVHQAIFDVVDFWLNEGVDGLRMDAIPYLYEREGTRCENLPETHAFIKLLRRHIDERFADRVLLAEANLWPEEALSYFDEGVECHMAFHFPLMPRLFLALQMEDRIPIQETLERVPPIPPSCQWALFLRNHDELTLEKVSEHERENLLYAYVNEERARFNQGIRRRLAPLMENDRRKIELMHVLLFSLPGTPFIYYGDEIGMGDNIFLDDRNGVRTPMQWSAGRNAGFSLANPQRLPLPPITDPEYHYRAVNVELQQRNPHSLLRWVQSMIALRRQHPAFGRGDFEILPVQNPHVLAFLRSYEDRRILVLCNLSHVAQPVGVDLGRFSGGMLTEMLGGVTFPPIGPEPYPFTLGPYDWYWFSIQ